MLTHTLSCSYVEFPKEFNKTDFCWRQQWPMIMMMDFQSGGRRFDAHSAVVPLGKELYFTPIAPACCADGHTTVLLHVHTTC